MRKIFPVAPALLLAACAAAPAPTEAPADTAAATPAGECDASRAQSFIGQNRSPETQAAILAATGSSQIRWVAPGMMVTMEFLSTRVTVHQGPDNRISRIVCG